MQAERIAIVILAGELGGPILEEGGRAELIVCADSGAEHARNAGIACHALVGDLDSLSLDTKNYFSRLGTEILSVSDQNHNDFEKALDYLSRKWSGSVHIYGMTGGRLDHTLSNLSVMLRNTNRFSDLRALDEKAEYRFLTTNRNQISIDCAENTTISLIPFGETNGITTQNLRYPLALETLCLGKREGLSNVATGSPVMVSIESGALLIAVLRQ